MRRLRGLSDWALLTFALPVLGIGYMLGLKTDYGRNAQFRQMAGSIAGIGGTSTAMSGNSLTDSGATWGTTNYVGGYVVVGTVYANILSHTGTVLTLDRWYNLATPGGSAGSTPGSTSVYAIMPGGSPAWFEGLSADTTPPANGDTTLPSEITTAGGGLVRKISVVAHTAGASTWTHTTVFTANGSDSLPVTVGKAGLSQSILSTMPNLFQTLVSPTATLSASGDQLTTTRTITE